MTTAITRIEGTALPLRGDDVDTDRIIPARFLVSVAFEGLGDDPRFSGARILLVNRNFGCGSSREHAPQALWRRGFGAIAGGSFSEIFFGNSVAIGMPCVTLSGEAIAELMDLVSNAPSTRLTVDIPSRTMAAGAKTFPLSLPENAREAFLTGRWDGTSMLLERFEEVEAVASRLPYLRDF